MSVVTTRTSTPSPHVSRCLPLGINHLVECRLGVARCLMESCHAEACKALRVSIRWESPVDSP